MRIWTCQLIMKSISDRALFHLTWIMLTTIPCVKPNDETTGWIHNITSQLCPYTDFCHTKASKVFNYAVQDQAPCCVDCSCDDDCIETNSCCPDKTMVSHNSTGLVCKNTMVKKRSGRRGDTKNYDGLSYGIKRYYITDSCPASETDNAIQHRCLGTNRTTLDDFVWVLDTATGKIFQNYHCAKCHGIESWDTFNIRTQCFNNPDNDFTNLTMALLSEDCNIINEISDEYAATTDKYQCLTPTILVCNQTGRWEQYDADIDEACQRQTVPYFQTDLFTTVIYKNPFCYVCNTEKMSGSELVCPVMNFHGRFNVFTFDALINYKRRSRQEDVRADSVCAVDESYDKYMGICRKLLCPYGSRPANGKCNTLAVNMNNLGINIMLKLRIDWNLTKLPDLNQTGPFSETDGEDIAKPVSQALKVKACTVCQLRMKVIDSTSRQPLPDLDYLLTVSTNTDCQYEWLHENIDNAIQRVIKVSLNRGRIFFRLQYEHRALSELPGAHDFLYFRRWTFCMFSVIPKVKFCPGIRLLNSEVESLKNQRAKRLLAPFFDAVHANDTDTAFICLADYFRIMEQTNTAQRIKVVWLALVWILLQICACC